MNVRVDDIRIRTYLQPGDLGFITYRHGKIYADEYDFGISFEAYVAQSVFEFYQQYNPEKDRVWVCEHNDSIVGFLLLMHRENNAAQLRYFYLEKEYRNLGLGRKLMNLFMDFYKKCRYTSCYLWTAHELTAAANLYKQYGFVLTEENESDSFGKRLFEQKYELKN